MSDNVIREAETYSKQPQGLNEKYNLSLKF